jgi:hypothetical protein
MDKTETLEINNPELLRLIDRNAPVERLATGFRFSEGPIWNPKEQCLYFSDMTSAVGGARATASSKCGTRATSATA